MSIDFSAFSDAFHSDGVFAYPTEAVYGLGCNPLSEKAMLALLALKSRPVEKGVILIADNLTQLHPFIDLQQVPTQNQARIYSTWPGPYTWLIPKSSHTPAWISGDSDMVAVRVTDHPMVKQMCNLVKSPLVSTSANPASAEPAKTAKQVREYFADTLLIIDGELGTQDTPSTIINSLTLATLR